MLEEMFGPLTDRYLYSVIATDARIDADGLVTWFYRGMPLLSPYVGVWPQPVKLEMYAA